MSGTDHTSEYHDSMVALLEWVWGEGFMAPGGEDNVRRLLQGIDTVDRHILDLGCGLGGPAQLMVQEHGARVTGVDLEPQLIASAQARAEARGLSDRLRFEQVVPGPLPFEDQSFDIVLSSGALTQTEAKPELLAELHRVLKPGGSFTCYEWLKAPGELSKDMRYFFEMEGLTYNLVTFEAFARQLGDAGFEAVSWADDGGWYRAECRREYEQLRGDDYARVIELVGQEEADHLVEDWRSLVVVCEQEELLQGYLRGMRPGAAG